MARSFEWDNNVPVPLNWLLASVIVLFLPLATGGENIYKQRKKKQWVTKEKTAHFTSLNPTNNYIAQPCDVLVK